MHWDAQQMREDKISQEMSVSSLESLRDRISKRSWMEPRLPSTPAPSEKDAPPSDRAEEKCPPGAWRSPEWQRGEEEGWGND